jgi:hypothetical protein
MTNNPPYKMTISAISHKLVFSKMLNDEPYKDTKPEFGHIYVLSNGNF